MRYRFAVPILLGAFALSAVVTNAQSKTTAYWGKWRGPKGNGISEDTDWNPKALAAKPETLWKTNIGAGYSSVSIKGSLLFTMGYRDGKDTIYCLRVKDGSEVWKHSYRCKKGQYPGPRATPIVDGKLIYTVSREGHVLCLDAVKGDVKWQKNLASDYGISIPGWGISSSAVVCGQLLIINAGKNGIALDKTNGRKRWGKGKKGGYATPVRYGTGGKSVAMFGQDTTKGIDAATGRVLWSFPWKTKYDVNAADPVVFDGKVFVASGYNRGCSLYNIRGGQPKSIWENKNLRAHFSSCVFFKGHIYGIDGNAGRGSLRCINPKNGSVLWSQDLGFGSLIAVGGKLIVLNEKGNLYIAEASPAGYKELGQAKVVSGPKCWTPPAFSRGLIYCRNDRGELVCVDVRK